MVATVATTGQNEWLTSRAGMVFIDGSSLRIVSTAGRGAACSQAAPAFLGEQLPAAWSKGRIQKKMAKHLTEGPLLPYIVHSNTPVSFGEGARSRFARAGSCFSEDPA